MFPVLHTTASERVKALDFSEDGSGLLAVGLYSGEVHVVSADDGRPYRTFTIQDAAVRAVKFIPGAALPLDLSAPDCRASDEATAAPAPCHLAAGCDDMHVYLYDVHGDVLLRTIKAHDDFIRSIALDPASPFVVTTSDDATARVWSRSFDLHHTLAGHNHFVMAAAIATLSNRATPDGTSRVSTALIATASLDCFVRLWFVSDGHAPISKCPPVCALGGHTSGVNTVAFVRPSLERLFVVSGSSDHEIRLWDAATKHCVAVLLGHTNKVSAVLCCQPAQGSIVSVSEDERIVHWALSDTNNRTWCAAAFADGDSQSIDEQNDTEEEKATICGGDDEARMTLDAPKLKRRAIRDRTDILYAPGTAISGRGWALAATARNGQVLVAIGTDNGFDVTVKGSVPPTSVSNHGALLTTKSRPHTIECAELVIGSCPDIVHRFQCNEDNEKNDSSSLHGSSGDNSNTDSDDDERRSLQRSSASDDAGRSRASAFRGLQRVSPAAKIVVAFVSALAVLSVILSGAVCVAAPLNPEVYLVVAVLFAVCASVYIGIVALEESRLLHRDNEHCCQGYCMRWVLLMLAMLGGFPVSFPLLFPKTLRRLVNKPKPHNVQCGTLHARLFVRGLATQRWWRWVATSALVKPIGRVASAASWTLLPVHVAFVYGISHITDELYTKDCTTHTCVKDRRALGSSALVAANAAFLLFYTLSTALFVPALVPIPSAAVFVLCATAFDYAMWVELALSPPSPHATAAWVVVGILIIAPAVIFVFCVVELVFSNFSRHQSMVRNIGLAVLGLFVGFIAIPVSVGISVCFSVASLSPVLFFVTWSFAPFSVLRARGLFHLFCEDGAPGVCASSLTAAQRTASLIKAHQAQSTSVEDPVRFPPPPVALFGQKKRGVRSRPGTRFFTSDLEDDTDTRGVDARSTVPIPAAGATPDVESWNPAVQLYMSSGTMLRGEAFRRGLVAAPRWITATPCFSVVWDLVWLACCVAKAIVKCDQRSRVSWLTGGIFLVIVLFPLRLLLIAVVAVVTLTTVPRSDNSALVQLLCLAVRAGATVGMALTSAAFLRFVARHVFLLSSQSVARVSTEWCAVIAATRQPSSAIVRHAVPGRVVPTVVAMWYVAPFIAPASIRQ